MLRALALFLILASPPALAGELRPFGADSFDAIRAEQAGRPFALVFWSIYCAPCISEMSLWKETIAAHPQAGLVLVSTDRPEDTPRVRRVLDRQGMADANTWQFADRLASRLRYRVDPRWRGALPRTYLFTAEGHAAAVITGQPTTAQVEAWLP